MIIEYDPKGVCARHFTIDVEDGIIRSARTIGGCPGNSVAVTRLLEGMTVEEAIKRLDGIRCGGKPTSCPDQIAQALKQCLICDAENS